MISLDSETCGSDFRKGAKPFMVTTCTEAGEQRSWLWDVDPRTREPRIPSEDLDEIAEHVFASGVEVVLQNAKYDFHALTSVGFWNYCDVETAWGQVQDTLIAAHLLHSNQPKDLNSLAIRWLGHDPQHFEDSLKEAVQKARKVVQLEYPDWKIAKEGDPSMPSVKKGSEWRLDYWLPRALAVEMGEPDDHPWYTVLSDYANADSEVTVALWKVMQVELERQNLWELYVEKMANLPVLWEMERRGITVLPDNLRALKSQYEQSAARSNQVCVSLSNGKLKELPGGVSNELRSVLFDDFGLKSPKTTKKGNVSMDKYVLDEWLIGLDRNSDSWNFVNNLKRYRKRRTALGYIDAYEKYQVVESDGRRQLYMSLNPTGTDTTRLSSSNPNGQQISKQEIAEDGEEGHSARFMFGPAPGRELWSIDYENIELRIPAYMAGEQLMIDLFERPDDPPYFGSNHLLFAHIIHEKFFEDACYSQFVKGHLDGRLFKEKYKETWYQWTKNGDFAVQYNAQVTSGTADRAYHVPGAQAKIESRLLNIKRYSNEQIAFANHYGYVETIPDRSIGAKRGYPLLCSRTERGGVKPTVPLSYHVQGTAGWCGIKAMNRCRPVLREWTEEDPRGYYMILNVHDELVFDFPLGGRRNLPKITFIKELMEQSGEDIGVPLKASVTYNPVSWDKGVSISA